ncbi:hypothetical protein GmHk_06G017591 [Glycine max]|nr:hypothetical protein GmHk_06G017591 [Glycine max]
MIFDPSPIRDREAHQEEQSCCIATAHLDPLHKELQIHLLLDVLELSENMLIRTVESWFFLLSPRQVDLANNTFTGVQISRTLSARGGGSNNSGNNNLAALNLGFNRIRGYAPTNLRVFPALSFLFIWYNMQHGAIPLEYRQIKSMKRLFLDEV